MTEHPSKRSINAWLAAVSVSVLHSKIPPLSSLSLTETTPASSPPLSPRRNQHWALFLDTAELQTSTALSSTGVVSTSNIVVPNPSEYRRSPEFVTAALRSTPTPAHLMRCSPTWRKSVWRALLGTKRMLPFVPTCSPKGGGEASPLYGWTTAVT